MRRDVAAMKKAVPLAEVVAHYLDLRKEGDEYIACCPFHGERTPSFKVYADESGQEWFKCFGCAEHGDTITFLTLIAKCNVGKAIDILEGFYKQRIRPKITLEEARVLFAGIAKKNQDDRQTDKQ